MSLFVQLQTSLITVLALVTIWCRMVPTASAFNVAFHLRDAVLAGALLQVLILVIRCIRQRSVARGCAPVGVNAALLLAAALACAWFWWVLAVVAAST